MRESERTGVALDRFFEVAAFEWSEKDRSPGAAVRQRHALLDYFASLPDQPIKRSEASWIWDSAALLDSLDRLKEFDGHLLEVDSDLTNRMGAVAAEKGIRTQDLAMELLRSGVEQEEIRKAPSVGTYWDILVDLGAYYISELHVFAGRDGEPEDIHLLCHPNNGSFLKAWTVVEELIDGTWSSYRHGLGHTGAQKRQRHYYEEITREEAVRLIHENAIPEIFKSDFERNDQGGKKTLPVSFQPNL